MTTTTAEYPTARLIEVFSAIQGEGLNVGTRQIFIRFALCDLRCQFCDSAHTGRPPTCRVERSPGLRDFETHSNPVSSPCYHGLSGKSPVCTTASVSLAANHLHAPS